MMILNTDHAHEFIRTWERDCASPERRARMFTIAADGIATAEAVARSQGREEMEADYRSARIMLRTAARTTLAPPHDPASDYEGEARAARRE